MKNVNLNVVLAEIELFIDENIDKFEFVVDMNDLHNVEIDFSDNSINVTECCSVFVREKEDKVIEKFYQDNTMKKVIKDNYILYIVC
jgi:hypothetical protein